MHLPDLFRINNAMAIRNIAKTTYIRSRSVFVLSVVVCSMRGVAVGARVGADVGADVGVGLEADVGTDVGPDVGLLVCPGVGPGVGFPFDPGVGLLVCPGVGLPVGPGVDFPFDLGVGLLVCPGVGLLVGWRVRLVAPGIVYSSDPANGTGGLLGSGKNAHFPLLYAKAIHVSRVVSLFRTSLHFFTQLVNVDTSFSHVGSMSYLSPV